jgi:hypothetical protein
VSRANPIAAAMPELEARRQPLQERFERFFPQLAGFARDELARLDRIDRA